MLIWQDKREVDRMLKRKLTLGSVSVVMHSSYQRESQGKADGKKKVMGRKEEVNNKDLWKSGD
jgi:hypothetical protein